MSAADVITYIGVPLAVLGVLPILYTTVTTFLNLRLIRRLLKHNKTTALTRASFVSGFIELTFSRTTLTPHDRDDDRYWEPRPVTTHYDYVPETTSVTCSPVVSSLPGAGWTAFQWRTRISGSKTYRVQRVEEVRTPQAEIDLGELVRFLVDRGAVVERRGWEVLRRAGMWTPAGMKLLTSHSAPRIGSGQSGLESAVLSVAVPEDSDGVLSLHVRWNREWARGRGADYDSMPPGWTLVRRKSILCAHETGSKVQSVSTEKQEKTSDTEVTSSSSRTNSVIDSRTTDVSSGLLEIQMAHFGIVAARCRMKEQDLKSNMQSSKAIDVSHLKDESMTATTSSASAITPSSWVSSAATALNGTSPTIVPSPLWPHTIQPLLAHLSNKACIPVGTLVILDLLPAASAPTWELSIDPDENIARRRQFNKTLEGLEEDRAISRLPPAQQAAARQAKMTRRARAMNTEHMEEVEERRLREERRIREALSSSKWASTAVGETCATWLAGGVQSGHELLPQGSGPRDAVEQVLWESIVQDKPTNEKTNGDAAIKVTKMLQLWWRWAEQGGMTREDLDKVADEKEVFAYAACILAVVGSFGGSMAEKTSEDVRECVVNWPVVRIG